MINDRCRDQFGRHLSGLKLCRVTVGNQGPMGDGRVEWRTYEQWINDARHAAVIYSPALECMPRRMSGTCRKLT